MIVRFSTNLRVLDIDHNYIALYKTLPQYSDKTSKSKRDTRFDKLSNTIKGEVFYSTSELLSACLLGGFARAQIIER